MTFTVRLDRDAYQYHEIIIDWCVELFGSMFGKADESNPLALSNRWQRHMMFGYQTYQFRDEKDAMIFILKWGQYQVDENGDSL